MDVNGYGALQDLQNLIYVQYVRLTSLSLCLCELAEIRFILKLCFRLKKGGYFRWYLEMSFFIHQSLSVSFTECFENLVNL